MLSTSQMLQRSARSAYKSSAPRLHAFLCRVRSWLIASLMGAIGLWATQAQALTAGTAVGWGLTGVWGQTSFPAALTNVSEIASGEFHGVALKSDGTVVVWGDNTYGQTNIPPGLSGMKAIAARGHHSLALKHDGTVVGFGWNDYGQTNIPAGLAGVTVIAAGHAHSLAIKGDGTVIGWGSNGYGESTAPAGLSSVVGIAAGNEYSLALKSDGTVVAWGQDYAGKTTVPAGLSGVVAIAAGGHHSLALKSDGTVVGWGTNDTGESTPPDGLSGVVAIAAGYHHSLALKSDGTVVGWGSNNSGESTAPAGLSGVTAIAAGGDVSLAANLVPLAPATTPYTFIGFFQPVDNLPTLNTVKAGSAIPVKFSLGGDKGLSILEQGYPVSQVVNCSTSAPTDAIEQTVNAGGSSLSYDAATGQYTYVWKTDKSWFGCRQFNLRLNDGTDHKALFIFGK